MKFITNLFYLIIGFITFFLKKRNSENSYQAFVKIYCLTNGLSSSIINICHRLFNKLINLKKKKISLIHSDKIKIVDKNIRQTDTILRNNSYFKFENLLNKKICDNILDYVYSLKGFANRDKNFKIRLDHNDPNVTFINYHEKDLIKNEYIQKLAANEIFLKICRDYFGTDPIISNIGVAVTYPTDEPKTEYAQLYHFDLDRLKWLKFFIYLSDVKKENGPHMYIEGSHKTFSKPYNLVKKGYVRIPDHEFFNHVSKSKERIITGDKGTILVGDTSAFHKGKSLTSGKRILLQIEYTSSLFGGNLDRIDLDENIFNKKNFYTNEIKNSKLFSRYNFIL